MMAMLTGAKQVMTLSMATVFGAWTGVWRRKTTRSLHLMGCSRSDSSLTRTYDTRVRDVSQPRDELTIKYLLTVQHAGGYVEEPWDRLSFGGTATITITAVRGYATQAAAVVATNVVVVSLKLFAFSRYGARTW